LKGGGWRRAVDSVPRHPPTNGIASALHPGARREWARSRHVLLRRQEGNIFVPSCRVHPGSYSQSVILRRTARMLALTRAADFDDPAAVARGAVLEPLSPGGAPNRGTGRWRATGLDAARVRFGEGSPVGPRSKAPAAASGPQPTAGPPLDLRWTAESRAPSRGALEIHRRGSVRSSAEGLIRPRQGLRFRPRRARSTSVYERTFTF
jgi:hypothetical protein